jgi:hypothetical protein
MAVITVPKILTERLTEQGAKALVDIINQSQLDAKNHVLEIVEGRFEKRLSEEMGKLRAEFHELAGSLRADIIRWMFIFWIGQAATTIGFLLPFLTRLR